MIEAVITIILIVWWFVFRNRDRIGLTDHAIYSIVPLSATAR